MAVRLVTTTRVAVAVVATALGATCLGAAARPLAPRWSQEAGVQVVGLGGVAREGAWNPLHLSVENPTGQPWQVVCQLVLPDSDGDLIQAERRVVLSPNRTHRVWLYGVPPAAARGRTAWRLRLLDAATRQPFDWREAAPQAWLDPHVRAIGVLGSHWMGLRPYASQPGRHVDYGLVTQFEATRFIFGMAPDQIPDRWQGLDVLSALIWAPDGGDPDGLTTSSQSALRHWVGRGGHLVIVAPAVADPWPASALRDLLPVVATPDRVRSTPPAWLGRPATRVPMRLTYRVFEPRRAHEPPQPRTGRWGTVSALLKDDADRPVVVAQAYGAGRVTLIGIDLTDPALTGADLPNGRELWGAVFGWSAPVLGQDVIDEQMADQRIARPAHRIAVLLDQFVPRMVAMHQTATPALLAAVILFGLYWLAAGPLGFAVLRMRKQTHNSWVAFVIVVGVFTVISWGGAAILRPDRTRISHFTVLDLYAGARLARVRSWVSLFVPRHERVSVTVGPPVAQDAPGGDTGGGPRRFGSDTLASPGFESAAGDTGFLDPRSYAIQAAAPCSTDVPIRATAKLLAIDQAGSFPAAFGPPAADLDNGDGLALISADGPITVADGWPAGRLWHGFSRPVLNVKIIYCPGDGQTPWVWGYDGADRWEPGKPLDLVPPRTADRLVGRAHPEQQPRQWAREGYLGRLIAAKTGQSWGVNDPGRALVASNEVIQAVEMLSFYDMLPPPDYRATALMSRPAGYERALGRGLDLSKTAMLRCLIVLGQVGGEALPASLRVDGARVPSTGWVVVRWVGPIADAPAATARDADAAGPARSQAP